MKLFKPALLALLLIVGGFPQAMLSETVTLLDSGGEIDYFEVNTADRFLDVLERIQSFYGGNASADAQEIEILLGSPRFDFEVSHAGITVRSKKIIERDYNVSVSKQEKKEMVYILTTLANKSLISIGTSKSSLKKAGDKIDHLHPYRFLMTIFNDEELKASVHAIRDRGGWIWEGFLDGIVGSLKEEAARDNIHAFTADFAHKVKIDQALIQASLQHGKWTEFINILIDKIPREIDPNRYDM